MYNQNIYVGAQAMIPEFKQLKYYYKIIININYSSTRILEIMIKDVVRNEIRND